MLKHALPLLLMLAALALLAGCGDDVADDPNLSEEGKAFIKEVGGPFSADEFERFLAVLPQIPGLHEALPTAGGEAIAWHKGVIEAVEAQGWSEERFMYIYDHTIATVQSDQMIRMQKQFHAHTDKMPEEKTTELRQAIGDQVDSQTTTAKAELDKQVPASEQQIIKDRMDDVLKALGI